ncbi:MAG: hypothetical protein OXE17_04335 [Chloroflexi bacterium]|nr:hypothetical protein [Chloroflexota bacterium]
MGYYNVWVVGPSPFSLVEEYDECNDIPASFPGLTFDFITDIEERGLASHFAALPNDELPFAVVFANGQIVRKAYPGSESDSRVLVGTEVMVEYLKARPEEIVTPMRWHN